MSEIVVDNETGPPIFGVIAEFDTTDAVVAAARRSYEEGYRRMDAYSPFPIEELTEALGIKHTRLPLLIFAGGAAGLLGGFFMQYYMTALDYQHNIGGRPLNSWPAFIPVTFETTILLASITAVFGMIMLNGLPQPYHPVFNVPRFELASRDRFFLVIEADDPKFDRDRTTSFLQTLNAREVSDVEA
ncbi:MAG: DUF3341 domain-containing protein [Pyrinomonadaceae bacterium]|nr:DUF3341 domain-containing protein [Pyrinomonadaceae bacterium]